MVKNHRKIAIIGTGISGLTCGYKLADDHDITLYEAADYIGGHTHTVDAARDDEEARIDTGFIVFNDHTYPNFIQLLNELKVAYQPTEMSFSVRNDEIDLEYNGNTFSSLFAQKSNYFRPKFWGMLRDIVRFNKDVRKESSSSPDLTIGQYLAREKYGSLFKDNYLLPMISAIWSMGLESCRDFPLHFFVRFFDNHGLLNVVNRPQWHTIEGGSSSYIEPLTAKFKDKIVLSNPVKRVERLAEGVRVTTAENEGMYDDVIFACHGDQALQILSEPSKDEQRVLQEFSFSDNLVVLHTDTSHLPVRKKAWASWNYRMIDAAREQTILTYNMNILQRLQKKHTYLVTLNQEIDSKHVINEYRYMHPIYTPAMVRAQEQWQQISGVNHIHYCGAYWFNGFHEDGVRSGLRVSEMLEVAL